jgi:hypothetical protein
MLTDYVKNRMLSKLGAEVVTVELTDHQMQDLHHNAELDWELYSTVSNLTLEKIDKIKYVWVDSYFQALCKEALGRIRGKYSGVVHAPGIENMVLDYTSLLKEAEQEKKELVSLLVPSGDKIMLAIYVNIGNLEGSEVSEYMKQVSEQLNDDKSYKFFLIPVKEQETKIECIYPNFLYDEEMKSKFNSALDKLIDNIKPNEQ